MDILCYFLFILLFLFIAACCVGYVVGIVWLIYKIVKLGDDFASEQKNLGSK